MPRLELLSKDEAALAVSCISEFLQDKGQNGTDMFRMVKLAFALTSGGYYHMRLTEDFQVAFQPNLYPPLRIISSGAFNTELSQELQNRLKVVLAKFSEIEQVPTVTVGT